MGSKVSTDRERSARQTEHRQENLDAHPNVNDASNGAFGVVDYDGSTLDDKNEVYLNAHPLSDSCGQLPCVLPFETLNQNGTPLKFDHLHTYRYYKSLRDHENVDQKHSDLFAKNALWAFISEIGAFEHDPCAQAKFGCCFDKLPRGTWEEHLRQFSTQTHKAIDLPQIFALYGLKTASKQVKILKELDRFCIDRENFCKLGPKFFQLYSCDRSLANFAFAVLQSTCYRNPCQKKLAEEVLKLYLIDQLKKLGYDFTKFINGFSINEMVRKDETCKTFCIFEKCHFKKCPKKAIRKCLCKCGRKRRRRSKCRQVCRPKHQVCTRKSRAHDHESCKTGCGPKRSVHSKHQVCRPRHSKHQVCKTGCSPKHSKHSDHSHDSGSDCEPEYPKSSHHGEITPLIDEYDENAPTIDSGSESDNVGKTTVSHELDPFLEFLLELLGAITLPKLPPCYEYKEDFALQLVTKILANLSLTLLAGFNGLGHFNHLKHLSCCLTVEQISTILQAKNLLELVLVKDESWSTYNTPAVGTRGYAPTSSAECWALFRCDLCDALFSKSSFCFHNVELTGLTDVNLKVFRKINELARDKLCIAMAKSHKDGDINCSLLLKQICSILASNPKLHHQINLCAKRTIILEHVEGITCKPIKRKPHAIVVKTHSYGNAGKSNRRHDGRHNGHVKGSKHSD